MQPALVCCNACLERKISLITLLLGVTRLLNSFTNKRFRILVRNRSHASGAQISWLSRAHRQLKKQAHLV